jgi:hypothetical protein
VDLEATILKGDRAETVRLVGTLFFREENNVGFVDWAKIGVEGVEIGQRFKEVVFHEVPVPLEESMTKTIRTWAGVVIHGEESGFYLINGERANQRGSLGGGKGGRANKG